MTTEQQLTPYALGQRDGVWTLEQMHKCGWDSPQACLDNEEKNYQEELENLPSLYESNPLYAAQHAEYMEGHITAARQSLQALMNE